MKRSKVTHYIQVTHLAIACVIEAKCSATVQCLWRELNDLCERQEREHRRFMSSFTTHHPRAASVKLCARYFAAMALCREAPEIRTWWTAMDVRRDWAIGYALGEALADLSLWSEVVRQGGMMRELSVIDYAKDLV